MNSLDLARLRGSLFHPCKRKRHVYFNRELASLFVNAKRVRVLELKNLCWGVPVFIELDNYLGMYYYSSSSAFDHPPSRISTDLLELSATR
jgi:hypothetical protein